MKTGIALAFRSPQRAAEAVRWLTLWGLSDVQAFGPYPAEELVRALPEKSSRLPLIAFLGGVLGLACAYALQYWTSVVQYPLNVGGRPLHSWPAFIPVSFELTVLFAAGSIFIGFLMLNGLPRLFHPLFRLPEFERASDDLFFIWVRRTSRSMEPDELRLKLQTLQPDGVYDVPP